jgi:hypothetical protein
MRIAKEPFADCADPKWEFHCAQGHLSDRALMGILPKSPTRSDLELSLMCIPLREFDLTPLHPQILSTDATDFRASG